jgi:hypothetical protein
MPVDGVCNIGAWLYYRRPLRSFSSPQYMELSRTQTGTFLNTRALVNEPVMRSGVPFTVELQIGSASSQIAVSQGVTLFAS